MVFLIAQHIKTFSKIEVTKLHKSTNLKDEKIFVYKS